MQSHQDFACESDLDKYFYYTDIERTPFEKAICSNCMAFIHGYSGLYIRDHKLWLCPQCKKLYRKKVRNARKRILEGMNRWTQMTQDTITKEELLKESG